MPSWPTRLFLGSSASSNSVANQPHPSADSDSHTDRQRGATRSAVHPRSPPVPPTNNLPNSSVPCRIPQHGRSISHPFPSIFGSGKKKTERGEEGDEDVVDAKALLTGSLGSHTADQTGMARPGAAPNNEGELITGRCATCDSQVRWPKNLHVYRCTVCLMVNDTKPNGPKSTPEDLLETEALHDCGSFKTKVSAEKEKADNVNQGQTKRTVVPYISFQKTQSLIDEGISSYLKGHLEEPEETDARSDDPPTASLQFSSNQPSAAVQGESSPENRGLLDPFRTVVNNQSAVLNRGTLDNLASTDHRALRPLPTSSGRGADTSDWHSPAESQMQPQSPSRPPPLPPVTLSDSPIQLSAKGSGRSRSDSSKSIFRSLENYIIACFSGIECLNASFPLISPPLPSRAKSDGLMIPISSSPTSAIISQGETPLSPLDAKTLLLGDFAENGTWWTGAARTVRSRSQKDINTLPEHARGGRVGTKSPRINWKDLYHWYHVVLNAGHSWKELAIKCETKISQELKMFKVGDPELQKLIERDLKEASLHLQRTLLKASETLLKRPGRPLKTPADCRFLLVLLNNPLLYPRNNDNPPWASPAAEELSPKRNNGSIHIKPRGLSPSSATDPSRPVRGRPKTTVTPNHSAITKRILGLLANLPIECHHYLVAWFSRFSEGHVRKLVELVSSFVTYRLSRQHSRKRSHGHGPPSELVPNLTGSGMGSSAQLHAALGLAGATKPPEERTGSVSYEEDWQIKAAARIMSLLFSANNNVTYRRSHSAEPPDVHGDPSMASSAASHSANKYGQMLPTSVFYNTLLDYSDLIADFEAWESRKAKFSFCQYPMFLSIWAKIRIMEHDARRQMEIKAREAFFDSIMNRKAVSQHVVLRVRRDCLVEDSLRGVSEVVGTGQEEIKKGLRIEFLHEEGIDAGGLRKEWFLLLVREVFDPEHGLFVYDEDSHYCYFNPNCFETSDQFFLVGVVLGLALYNSTILDVALPPFAFRKLLASAPAYMGPVISSVRSVVTYTLDDLAEYRPSLAKGLQQLLDFEGDVESTFCRDFVAEVDRYGQNVHIPLCPNGESRPVTNTNRREFVDLYVRYLLDTAVARQFEPFKRGFFTVCGGNALSLFRPEEIELLVRGSDEPLDVATLQAVATYEGWGKSTIPADEPVVQWFWQTFKAADPRMQRKLLSFITASDRIPAMGAANLVIKIACLGNDASRFPTARTCFNRLGLYRYSTRQDFDSRLWTAVLESEGFGIK